MAVTSMVPPAMASDVKKRIRKYTYIRAQGNTTLEHYNTCIIWSTYMYWCYVYMCFMMLHAEKMCVSILDFNLDPLVSSHACGFYYHV